MEPNAPPPKSQEPYVSASRSLPEITFKGVILAIVLSAVLSAANAYLGLLVGLTVSASIPAAVISMGVLKIFRRSNILENNAVQTAASAGESLAAGVIFTMPALILLGVWTEFDYLETTLIAGFGGLLGVLFTIPLRRALIVDDPLLFPEGVATAEVLKVGDGGSSLVEADAAGVRAPTNPEDAAEARRGIRTMAAAGLVGGLFKFGEAGLKLWGGSVETARFAGSSLLYFGSNLSPALVAVGYIVGLNIAVLVFLGGALNWLVAIPILATMDGYRSVAEASIVAGGGEVDAVGLAAKLWSTQTRYLGVGAMVVGGLWALVKLRKSLVGGIRSGMAAYRESRDGSAGTVPRTERDTPFQWVAAALVAAIVPLFLIYEHFTGDAAVSAVMAVVMLVAGFLFSAVAGYMAGLVGSSNNPISGVTIATILFASLLLLVMLGADDPRGPAAAIFIGATVCCAAAIAGDNMQDLKAGNIVGATPWKQQLMQVVGVLAAAVVIAPVLTLLLKAYGIGPATAARPDSLAAPQATLMASVAQGVFEGGLPWTMAAIGGALAVLIILADVYLEGAGSKFRMPVLAVAVGIYLPFELSVPIFLGGLIAWAVSRAFRGDAQGSGKRAERGGLLFSAGLITGEALVGIGMAIPIVATEDENVLAFWGEFHRAWPGVLLLGLVILGLYKVSISAGKARAA